MAGMRAVHKKNGTTFKYRQYISLRTWANGDLVM